MRYLSRIRILAFDYDIEYVPNLAIDADNIAEHIPGKRIRVDSYSARNGLESYLMHEVFESIKWQLAIDLPHKDLEALSTAITVVLQDNPEFTKMFFRNAETKH